MSQRKNAGSKALRRRAGAYLQQNLETVFQRWEDEVQRSVPAARGQSSLLLRDHLMPYMTVMIDLLDRADVSTAREKLESNPSLAETANATHGRLRATLPGYSIGQLVEEYICLRQVISDMLAQQALLDHHVLEIVAAVNEHAIGFAASQFTQSLQILREKAVSMLMHDIRNPLNVVSLTAMAASKQATDPALEQQLKSIVKNARRIDEMAGELLDAVRLEAGEGLELEFEQTDLREIVKESTDSAVLAHPNRVEVVLPEQAVEGRFDRSSISRAVENLLSNALNHGASGERIRVELKKEERNNIISVHNWGAPIDDQERAVLFVAFARGSGASSRAQRGWGLGLTYVKAVAEGHGGSVRVDSSEDGGTTFSIVLPAR